MELEKVYVRFPKNNAFEIVGSVLRVEKEKKYFIKYFFSGLRHLSKNLKETSNIDLSCKKGCFSIVTMLKVAIIFFKVGV